ncbi:hypothetical protein pmac_cds_463 [Pandoravirus macleodensis]|uniref:Uncharacterized protein n=1 Tax=Pandoravirus macleodensis TaxID=2107707 RepID=A0A2U7UGL3_9VIRU|nr:hypothetical protein pmac_cds_463 [Pandoravirus macleodensis]AVK77151.1 hypothetical protein pmac_cds_463 [Pandoravirus macleodensis]
MANTRVAWDDPEFDAAVRMCAALQRDPPVALLPDDVERLAAYGRYARTPITGPWSPRAQCEALARVGGPAWASAIQAQLARPHGSLQRDYSDTTLLSSTLRPYPAKRRRLTPLQPQPEAPTTMQASMPTQASTVAYERTLPVELQDAIMRHLARVDPRTALALGASGRQQAEVLAALSASMRTGGTDTDPVRTAAALGVDDGSPIGVAIVLCILQGLAEFRVTQGIDTVPRSERDVWGAVTVPGQGHPSNLVERVALDDRIAGTRDRAQIWYQWLTTSPFGPTGQGNTRIERLYGPMRASFRDVGKFDVVDLLRMSQTGIEVGQGTAPPELSITAQPIASFVPPYTRLAVLLDCNVSAHELDEWATQGWLDDRVMPDQDVMEALGSSQAFENLARFVNEGVRAHLTRRCAVTRPDGRAVVPNFTDVFDLRLYLVPLDSHIVLMADIGTPRVQELLF